MVMLFSDSKQLPGYRRKSVHKLLKNLQLLLWQLICEINKSTSVIVHELKTLQYKGGKKSMLPSAAAGM